jgi:hypothetical protein
MERAPSKKGAPGKYIVVLGEVKWENKPVIIKGLMMEEALIRLVSVPCNSPCSFAGT